jgi:hypothetical protein
LGDPAVALSVASGLSAAFAQAVAGKVDAIGVVDDAVEDGVGESGNSNQVVPSFDGNLARDDQRSLVVPVFDDFEQIPGLGRREGLWSPIVEDEQLYT